MQTDLFLMVCLPTNIFVRKLFKATKPIVKVHLIILMMVFGIGSWASATFQRIYLEKFLGARCNQEDTPVQLRNRGKP